MQRHRVTRRSKTVIAIACVAVGVLALLGVIEFALSGNDSTAQPPATNTTTTTTDSTETPDGALESTGPSTEAKVVTGSFKQQRGMLTIEVTRVELANGRLRLSVTATNGSQARMTLPVDGISVQDDLKRTYVASTSKWEGLVTQGTKTSGTVILDERLGAGVNSLTLTFGSISGQFAPTGGAVSVAGIPVPK